MVSGYWSGSIPDEAAGSCARMLTSSARVVAWLGGEVGSVGVIVIQR